MAFDIRRVVTGHDAEGRAGFRSDGIPPRTIDAPNGFGVSEVLWLDGAPTSVDDGRDVTDGPFALEPPAGGCSLRVIRMPTSAPGAPLEQQWLRVPGDDDAEPGMHATDTLDFMVVLDGEIVLGTDDGERVLGVGDTVVQRGTRHRWRVHGDRPCTYAVCMVRPDPESTGDVSGLGPGGVGQHGPRRVVVTAGGDGSSAVSADGQAPCGFATGGNAGVALVDLWQTGGPCADASQGGDPPAPWALDPQGGGVAFRAIEMGAGNDPGDAGWHATDTIDVDIVVHGQLELALPDCDPVVLGPGDCVVQRGTMHRWRPVGEAGVRYVAVMLPVQPPAARPSA
jgi:mannose-6-phosphate isomerase-like protein (cupin superfamily)